MEAIRSWITGIAAVAILVGIAKSIAPNNAAGEITRVVAAVLLIIAILAPIKSIHVSNIFKAERNYNVSQNKLDKKATTENEKIATSIIENELSTYISKRAEQIGIKCVIRTECKKLESQIAPYAAIIKTNGNVTSTKRKELSEIISKECAIPKSRQTWKG
ncbi:MAG: hypothetical protein RR994_01690 [Clostridia bacterium]